MGVCDDVGVLYSCLYKVLYWVVAVISRRVMLRSIKRLYGWARNDPVDEELRGWSWDRPPVKPRAYLGLTVSEVAYRYCPVYRDIWLRRKLGVRPGENDAMFRGRIMHETLNHAYRLALNYMVRGEPGWLIYERIRGRWRDIVVPDEEIKKVDEAVMKVTGIKNASI
jgi:CRISPR-associated protein Csa1